MKCTLALTLTTPLFHTKHSEETLQEVVPSIGASAAKRLALKLSSLQAFSGRTGRRNLQKLKRHHILLNEIGKEKYIEAISLANEIRHIRNRSAVWTKFSSHAREEKEGPLPASKMLPKPIADLYFHTPLIDVMVAIDSGSNGFRSIDWDALLIDASQTLSAYRKFENENVREDENLMFGCTSGLCGLRLKNM